MKGNNFCLKTLTVKAHLSGLVSFKASKQQMQHYFFRLVDLVFLLFHVQRVEKLAALLLTKDQVQINDLSQE